MTEARHEKSPLDSKKFIAFLIASIGWQSLMGYGLYLCEQPDTNVGTVSIISLLLSMALLQGFLQVVYIGSQAAVDKFVRVAEIAAGAGKTQNSVPIPVESNQAQEIKE